MKEKMVKTDIRKFLQKKFVDSSEFRQFVDLCQKSEDVYVSGLAGSSKAILASLTFVELGLPGLHIFPNQEMAAQFYQDALAFLESDEKIVFLPAIGRQSWSEVGPPSSEVGKKLKGLKSILLDRDKIVIAPVQAVTEKLASFPLLNQKRIFLEEGTDFDFNTFIENLVDYGYNREQRVDAPGEMSVRGGLIDLFPLECVNPIRIEFFGDQVESIRAFDVENQISIGKVDSLTIIPAGSIGLYGPYDEQPLGKLPLNASVMDFCENSQIWLYDEPLLFAELDGFYKDLLVKLETFVEEHNIDSSSLFNEFYFGMDQIEKMLNQRIKILVSGGFAQHESFLDFNIQRNNQFGGNFKLFKNEIQSIIKNDKNSFVSIVCDSDSQTSRLAAIVDQEAFPEGIAVETLDFFEGFSWESEGVSIYTNREIFGRIRLPKLDKVETRKISFKNFSAIRKGDFVVHTDYGIGIFRGLKPIKAYGKERECIELEYQDGDKLYVPLEKMDRVQKYSAKEGITPALSKLGSPQWEKLKIKTKDKIKKIAAQLIKLYAKRKFIPGYAFPKDTVWQSELEASFEFEETLDQLTATEAIKEDMEKNAPMDRLLCGDVGFGKTEVALRAAFKAINGGKQVALLVPTTVLAQQHFDTFRNRYSKYPVNINVLSRFKTNREQKEIIADLSAGKIDMIIGTHRLLSKDIQFKDLGLLIIDEEQKFGVVHKERLKFFKEIVDTLILSATPIPRTMHMSLIGAKDMSVINTPPSNRIPIKTEVCRFDKELIRNAILKEADRGGQVFFVHNRVQSIYGILQMLHELIPEVKFGVAHGQMKSSELEKVMIRFTSREIQCLVCTMIIESGLDVPNANTLIVNRSDKFGLSQLYQLRGRVGRSGQQAFAYLLIPSMRKLTREAIKRLQTIQEYTHLGSGYKVAMRDLEIRGAGNIFGAEQSGFVQALGFELYAKIIEEAIKEIRIELNMATAEDEKYNSFETKVDLNMDAYLPNSYVSDAAERVDLYKRLIESQSIQQIEDIRKELRDRFGPLPESAQNLIDYVLLKPLSNRALIDQLKFSDGKVSGKFHKELVPAGELFREWIGRIVQKSEIPFELKQDKEHLYFEIDVPQKSSSIDSVKKFLQSIA